MDTFHISVHDAGLMQTFQSFCQFSCHNHNIFLGEAVVGGSHLNYQGVSKLGRQTRVYLPSDDPCINKTYQSFNAPTRTVFADQPQLAMDR